jgi:hypothetical protein
MVREREREREREEVGLVVGDGAVMCCVVVGRFD